MPPRPITPSENFLLSPFQKLWSHNIFPFQFTLHLMLLFLVTMQVLIFNYQDALYSRTMHKGFKNFFMPASFSVTANPDAAVLYNLGDTLQAAQRVSDSFFTLPYQSIAAMGFLANDEAADGIQDSYYSSCHTGNKTFSMSPSEMKLPTLTVYK